MDPLSALSIACNVMQVISFGLETISLCKKIYETGHPDLGLIESGRHLEGIGRSLTQQLKQPSTSLTAKDKEFIKVANQCAVDARALQDEAAYLAPKKAHEIRGAIMAAGRSLWHRKKLKKLEENLSRSQRLLETCLLGRICDESQANAIQNRKDFANLDRTLQDFVKQYAEGQRTLSGLLQANFQTLKDHVTKDSDITRQEVTAHITNELVSHHQGIEDKITTGTAKVPQEIVDSLREEQRLKDGMEERQRLLESLKYPETNARYNKISETCPNTFKWVFDPDISDINSSGNPGAALLKWLKSDGRTFWISGKPGSGKSTLTKFIVMHPRTREALEQWREQTRIIHHFFWLPGSEMQNSIHGMLCSLLHQSLLEYFLTLKLQEEETHRHVEATVFLRFPELKTKSFHWDWSTADLMNVLFYHLESSSLTYCFFLDGLDEVVPKDGPHRLLQVLDRLMLLQSVKLCVSSRPEHVFTTRFETTPSLRMQDLIAPDIEAYAYEVFKEQSGISVLPDYVHRIIRIITDKADGVFLWAVLVLESFKRGLYNGDTWDELQRRLDIVPMDLMDLYRDMWSRLNDDGAIYKETAALYISLLKRYKDLGGIKCPIFWGSSEQLTVMDFMAASISRSEIDNFLGKSAKAQNLDLDNECEQAIRNINIRCGGLLAIYPQKKDTVDLDRSEYWQHVCHETSYGHLLRYLLMTVDFVHRSAYDFLVDTEDGRQIWRICELTDFQLLCHLVRGRMTRFRVLGSIAPWMHEHGGAESLWAIEDNCDTSRIVKICDMLFQATENQHITSAEAEILLSILSRAFYNGDLLFHINPKEIADIPSSIRLVALEPQHDFLALVFQTFDTFVENYIVRHADNLPAKSLCYALVGICSDFDQHRTSYNATFPRTIRFLLRRMEVYMKSRGADTDVPVHRYAQMTYDELLHIIIYKWPVGHYRDIIKDIIAFPLSSVGAYLDRCLTIRLWCEPDGPFNCDLEVLDVFGQPDEADVLQRPRDNLRALKSPAKSFYPRSLWNEKSGLAVLLEVSVSFAIKCAFLRHFCKGEDRPACVGHQEHPQLCRVVRIADAWVGQEDEDDDLLKLTSLLSSGLVEDPYCSADAEVIDLGEKVWNRITTRAEDTVETGVTEVAEDAEDTEDTDELWLIP